MLNEWPGRPPTPGSGFQARGLVGGSLSLSLSPSPSPACRSASGCLAQRAEAPAGPAPANEQPGLGEEPGLGAGQWASQECWAALALSSRPAPTKSSQRPARAIRADTCLLRAGTSWPS